MNAIILCGGLSTRLGDITKSVPKVLLEVGDKTVLDWQLSKLQSVGIDSVVMAAGHLSEVLQREVGTERNGIKIQYVIEEKKLGTGGAIKNALQFVPNSDKPTLILNGDILTSINLRDMIACNKAESDGIILGAFVSDVASYGTLVYDKNYHLLAFKEKEGLHISGYQNGGFYLFNARISKYFPKQDCFSIEYDVFPHMKDLYVYESDKPWIDIGIPERLEWAREHAEIF